MLKKTFPLVIAVLLVSLLVGCGAAPVNPIELVPQNADMLVYMDLSRIMEDEEEISEFYSALPIDPETQQALDDALEILSGLEEGLVFGNVLEITGEDGYSGLILKGPFVENELIAMIESLTGEGLAPVGYREYKIYADPFQEMGLVFLGSDGLVVGEMQPVKDVIDVREGDESAVGGKVLDTYDGLGDAMVKMAMAIPPGLVQQGLQYALGILQTELPAELPGLGALADIETIGMAVDEDEELSLIQLQLCFTSSDSAESVKGLITLVKATIGTGLLPIDIPEEVQTLLESLDVSTSDSCVNISLEMPTEQIKKLMLDLVTIASTQTGGLDFPLDSLN